MTAEEFAREFDLLYNNIMSNFAPSIDAYEKSVFLTKAQEEIVTAIYDGSFEVNEKSTEYLAKLVKTDLLKYSPEKDIDSSEKISPDSKVFELPSDILFITYEALKVKGDCGTRIVLTKPTRQDEYYRISRNPFRRARKNEALRLRIENKAEIISPYTDYEYQIRYIRRPKPIILFDPKEAEGLSIDGYSTYDKDNPCELDPMLHRAIVEAAVKMAAEVYKKTTN